MKTFKRTLGFTCAVLALAICSSAANDKVTFRPLPEAILRIDDQAPKLWNLFRGGKKADPLLLQLGARSLVIYVQQQKVYEIPSVQLQAKGENVLWNEPDKADPLLASSEWTVRDVGAAWRVRLKLSAEGRVVDIQIP